MDGTPPAGRGRQIIERYGAGRFRIAGVDHVGSVLVFPWRTLAWSVAQIDQLTTAGLAPVLEASASVELLLLGTGPRMEAMPTGLHEALRGAGVKVEAMDTGAACRTFNVLVAEERRVAAALIAVD
ncbi:MAG: Mth938-like domain-containing protein [Kiloniellales bacterium]